MFEKIAESTTPDIVALETSAYPLTIIVTGNAEIDSAVNCMRSGAFDYLVKPIEKNKMLATVSRAVEILELREENDALRTQLFSDDLRNPDAFVEIITESENMKSVFRYVEAISPTTQPVLVTGETGVGKELIVQAIHRLSGRTGPLIAVNVAGFDDSMFADSLFGHRKGSFTGASQPRGGLIETAKGGTLFLDEIGDLSIASQVKLLRLLESREYFPLGSDIPRKSEARIVVATHRGIEEASDVGTFRKDLYYRLHTHHVDIPPLRDRLDDLPILIDHFLLEACADLGIDTLSAPAELSELLRNYAFPGNVRELKSLIFDSTTRLNSMGDTSGTLTLDIIESAIRGGERDRAPSNDGNGTLLFTDQLPTIRQATFLLVQEAMRRAKGKQKIASHMLGITQQALSKRLQQKKAVIG